MFDFMKMRFHETISPIFQFPLTQILHGTRAAKFSFMDNRHGQLNKKC